MIMKKLLLAAALATVFVASALAEDSRDQAYGKHDMGPSPDSSMSIGAAISDVRMTASSNLSVTLSVMTPSR